MSGSMSVGQMPSIDTVWAKLSSLAGSQGVNLPQNLRSTLEGQLDELSATIAEFMGGDSATELDSPAESFEKLFALGAALAPINNAMIEAIAETGLDLPEGFLKQA